jgi:hypothetical protein
MSCSEVGRVSFIDMCLSTQLLPLLARLSLCDMLQFLLLRARYATCLVMKSL